MSAKPFQFLIKGYQRFISPLLGDNCRYYPTCSAYSHEAFEKHGVLKGLYLTLHRLLRCHPWGGTNWTDPVPDQFAWGTLFRYKRADKACTCKHHSHHQTE